MGEWKLTKYCPECGAETNHHLSYCQNCGINQPSHFLTNSHKVETQTTKNIQNVIQHDKKTQKTKEKSIQIKSTTNDKFSIREFIKLYLESSIKEKSIVTFEFLILVFFIVAVPPLGLSILAVIIACYLLNKLNIIKL